MQPCWTTCCWPPEELEGGRIFRLFYQAKQEQLTSVDGLRIWLVDGNEMLRDTLTLLLQSARAELWSAHGVEAVRAQLEFRRRLSSVAQMDHPAATPGRRADGTLAHKQQHDDLRSPSPARQAALQPQLQYGRVLADSQQAIMKSLFALMLANVCFQALAANLQPCDKGVRFMAAWFADPEVDTTKPAAELTKIGARAGHSGTQLGHVVVETTLAVKPQTTCQGLVVRLDYSKPVLRVASEIPPGSCAFARVMNHEQTHVRIHRDIARQFRELDYPWSSGGNSAAILTFAKQELDRLMQAQVLFDSPEEYARNLSVCNGEIVRLVKPAASTKSGQTPG